MEILIFTATNELIFAGKKLFPGLRELSCALNQGEFMKKGNSLVSEIEEARLFL
jgi:hypothetical protein